MVLLYIHLPYILYSLHNSLIIKIFFFILELILTVVISILWVMVDYEHVHFIMLGEDSLLSTRVVTHPGDIDAEPCLTLSLNGDSSQPQRPTRPLIHNRIITSVRIR